jgi:acyl-CoA thioester hydrolase
MNDFTHKFELRIDWSEIDLFEHVNNLAILKYVQTARINFLEKFDLMQMQTREKKDPILASMKSQFKKPLFYPGKVVICSKIVWIKNSSFCMHHNVFNENNELAAEVEDIIVFYDFIKNIKLLIPDGLRRKMEACL